MDLHSEECLDVSRRQIETVDFTSYNQTSESLLELLGWDMKSEILFLRDGFFDPLNTLTLVSSKVASESSLDFPCWFSIDTLPSLIEGPWHNPPG